MSTTPRNPKKQNSGVDCSGANRVSMGMYHSECLCVGEGGMSTTPRDPKNQNPGVDCSGANRVLMGMYHSEC